MRIPSGKIDQYIYFVALDSNDYKTRKTGLSSFTVYRSRDGGAATAYTTPTVTEVDSTNMPGVYQFLIDEDTTIGSSSDSEEYVVHITATGMVPVTRSIELYRRAVTSGETVTTASGKVALTTTEHQNIAQKTLSEPIDNAESAATAKSLLWFLASQLNKAALAAGTITTYKTDNSTVLFTKSVTQTPADPITSSLEAS